MSIPSPFAELEISAGTLKATVAHGHVYYAFRRRGARSWETSRKSLDEAQAFVGTLADHIANARFLNRLSQES
ncbi:hypothetical protein [Methylobacterium sp. WL7]|uniref:hypothetical protein n=1 Tax=Methylobacterium sp. WL7 TaxID=2603900 RepID=UPI0011C78F1B|nr:hypothetical protein [Methylobacterium sp. WL7]TXN40521.1 hypothetical protein FV233_26635 [Methylobacterium sp. WL7]